MMVSISAHYLSRIIENISGWYCRNLFFFSAQLPRILPMENPMLLARKLLQRHALPMPMNLFCACLTVMILWWANAAANSGVDVSPSPSATAGAARDVGFRRGRGLLEVAAGGRSRWNALDTVSRPWRRDGDPGQDRHHPPCGRALGLCRRALPACGILDCRQPRHGALPGNPRRY